MKSNFKSVTLLKKRNKRSNFMSNFTAYNRSISLAFKLSSVPDTVTQD